MGIAEMRAERRLRRLKRTLLKETIRPHRHKRFSGVGDALIFLFKEEFGAEACGACIKLAGEMDRDGPDEVLRMLDHYATRLHENTESLAESRGGGWIILLEYLAYKTSGLHFHRQKITEAINLYRTTTPK